MTFTSVLRDSDIEKYFYDFLRDRGIEVNVESNEVNEKINK